MNIDAQLVLDGTLQQSGTCFHPNMFICLYIHAHAERNLERLSLERDPCFYDGAVIIQVRQAIGIEMELDVPLFL